MKPSDLLPIGEIVSVGAPSAVELPVEEQPAPSRTVVCEFCESRLDSHGALVAMGDAAKKMRQCVDDFEQKERERRSALERAESLDEIQRSLEEQLRRAKRIFPSLVDSDGRFKA